MIKQYINENFPKKHLGNFPSRVFTVDSYPNIWIKDDGSSSATYSGNKLRKLEFILEKADIKNMNSLIVMGDQESHTVMSTALLGQECGFKVNAIIYRASGQNYSSKSIDFLEKSGVKIHRCRNFATAFVKARFLNISKKSYYINLGATEELSNLGYILAAFELEDQINQNLLPSPNFIYLPYATAGTVSGLMIGLAILNSPIRIVGVRTVSKFIANKKRLIRLINKTLALINLSTTISLDRVMERLSLIDNTQIGTSYGVGTESSFRAVTEAKQFGLVLEPIFSGKAFASILRDAEESPDKKYLFWNTHDQNIKL
jgi:D-cysteine desulfhydrase